MFDKFFTWLLQSSQNPKATSLAVQATLTALVTYGTMLAGFGHVQLPTDLLTQFVDGVVQAVQVGLLFISIVAGLWGVARKIWNTVTGNHASLNVA